MAFRAVEQSCGVRICTLVMAMTMVLLAPCSRAFAKTVYSEAEMAAVETKDEARIREIRGQELTQLRIALGRRSEKNRQADLYFRLAEIYLEAYRAEYLREGRVHEKRLEKGLPSKVLDHSWSRPYLEKGVKACQEILSLGIPYGKLDQVHYFLGFNYAELGNRSESLRYFTILTVKFPDSPFAAEARRELGDAAYGAGDYRKAQAEYLEATKKGDQAALPRIHHKLAWTYYRTRQYERAIDAMKVAITLAGKSGEKFLSLREEALRDMAIFMTEAGKADEAIAYFQSVAGDKDFYPRTLEKLGRQYERNVEPAKATQVYESLLKSHPGSEAAFRSLVKLVDLDLRRGRHKDALARIAGIKLFVGGDSETQVAAQNLRAMVRRTATEHHEKFRKSANKADLELAEGYYVAYLKEFLVADDSRKEMSEIEMYLAEVKRELGKPNEASDIYRKVIASKDSRYAKEAGALWTASLADAIKKSGVHGKKGDEPSALEKEYVEAADRLQDALGETTDGREAALKATQILAGYQSTQKAAIKRMRKLIESSPKSQQALVAARLWLQILADRLSPVAGEKGDSADDIKDVIKELGRNEVLMAADTEAGGGKLKHMIGDLETRMKIGQIARNERDQNFKAAASGYESFAEASVKQDLADKAYASAIGNYLKIPDAISVDRVLGAWLKRFPKTNAAVESGRSAATRFLIRGDFDFAARLFEKLGSDGHDADSLETAARILEGIGDNAGSARIRAHFLESHAKSSSRWAVALSLARAQDTAKQDVEAVKNYRFCIGGPPEFEAECGARLSDLYLRLRDVAQAKVTYKSVASRDSKGGLSPFVGYARFRLAELMEQDAKFDSLSLPDALLKKALKQRLDFLDPLSKAYLSAVEAGGPWAIAALDRLAAWAMAFAYEVDGIQPPQSADSDGIAKFNKTLAGISGPLRKRAVSAWNDGYSKAIATDTLSLALPEIVDRLADAKLAFPARAQGSHGQFRLAGIPAGGGTDGQAKSLQKVRGRLLKSSNDVVAWIDYGNLLWGSGKPRLARIAYDHALSLSANDPSALNNRAVLRLGTEGADDWYVAAEAVLLFRDALKREEFFLPAKINLALLLNYYRLFSKAKPLWEQLSVKAQGPEIEDGHGVAFQGMGNAHEAEAAFKKATELGLPQTRFVNVYNEAARVSTRGRDGVEKCLALLGDLDEGALSGVERGAVERLRRICTQWKSEK